MTELEELLDELDVTELLELELEEPLDVPELLLELDVPELLELEELGLL